MTDISTRKKNKTEDEDKIFNYIQENLDNVNSIQKELENINKHMTAKLLIIADEFSTMKKPFYNRRAELLIKVPHFWAISFMNHPKLKNLVNDSVEDCFNYLIDLQIIENDDIKTGYKILFTFEDNPYFLNSVIIKYNSFENGIMCSQKTNIDWKENMNITGDRKNQGRKRSAPVEHFFDWVQRTAGKRVDVVCDIIRDDLWIDPLKYYFLTDDRGDDATSSDSDEESDEDEMFDSNEEDDTIA